MATIVTVDSAGRVVIPKPLRDELRLEPGDTLSLETDGERVTLSPVRPRSAMRKENGVWVFRSGSVVSAADTDKTLESVRTSRDRSARG